MNKKTLLAATALTITCLGSQSLTAMAAPKSTADSFSSGKTFYFYSPECATNLQGILDKLQNCFPDITLPDCNKPDTDAPETDAPETNVPDADAPGQDIPETNEPDTDTPADEHAFISVVVNLVNEERAKENLSPLTIDSKVQAAAQVRAQECEQLFSHTRPDGTSFSTALKEQNVTYRSAGENIAWGQQTPQEVVTAWMNSPGHRANIMNANFTTIGVGYYENANGTDYWCQLFTK